MEGGQNNGGNTCRFDGASGAPRDLMYKLVKRSRSPTESVEREKDEKEELELSLGLSMNGRFGVDPAMKKIRRSSSVSNVVFPVAYAGNGGERKASGVELGGHAPLLRTSSLPPDTLREEGRTGNVDGEEGLHQHGGGHECSAVKMGHDGLEKRHIQRFPTKFTGSRDLQSQLVEGATQPPTNWVAVRGLPALVAKTEKLPLTSAAMDMPYVSTRGYGPNHNKIEGFLYRYKRAEELKIVCVCHGLFLSPAEFVKHGGGGDVDYPLKHIIVNPYPLY